MADYLAEAVFEPLRMRHSALVGPAGMGAVSTVEDLTQFAGELLAPGLISPETFALATVAGLPRARWRAAGIRAGKSRATSASASRSATTRPRTGPAR